MASPSNPERSLGKRKADEITVDEKKKEDTNDVQEPEPKKVKVEEEVNSVLQRWDVGMEMPQGKRRACFGGFADDRITGTCTVDDPKVIWLGKVPSNTEMKEANEDIARRAASLLKTITHIYIVCGTQSSKFVDRDGKRIHIWYPDAIRFHHQTTAADPHMILAFGTKADHVSLYGYINVTVDENGKPTDIATSRNEDYVVDGDDRIFELFAYEDEEKDCSSYCSRHKDGEKLINACEDARPERCPVHNTDNLLDHFCSQPQLNTEILGDHYCPCHHNTDGLLDHYCPCPHEDIRVWNPRPHRAHKKKMKTKKKQGNPFPRYLPY